MTNVLKFILVLLLWKAVAVKAATNVTHAPKAPIGFKKQAVINSCRNINSIATTGHTDCLIGGSERSGKCLSGI